MLGSTIILWKNASYFEILPAKYPYVQKPPPKSDFHSRICSLSGLLLALLPETLSTLLTRPEPVRNRQNKLNDFEIFNATHNSMLVRI